MKFFRNFLLVCFAFLLIAATVLFTPIDKNPYDTTDAYGITMNEIDNLEAFSHSQEGIFRAGWAKVNLVPEFKTPIAIDAARGGKPFESVRDSVYIRSLVFEMGATKIALISADLLIVPPIVVDLVDSILHDYGYSRKNIFYTATHTHTSIGAWHNSCVGEIFAGKYDERVPLHIANVMAQSVLDAENNLSVCSMGSMVVPAVNLVVNRLVGDAGRVDSMMRMIKLENESGDMALLFSFTAHATVFHEHVMQLSGDWPGAAVSIIESERPDVFAVFAAGAVGSHGPYEYSKNQEEELEYISGGAASVVLQYVDSIETNGVGHLGMHYLPVKTRKPHFRVNQHFALRPVWFNRLFGEASLHVNFLRLGNNYLVGMPCDFSGELTLDIEPEVKKLDCELFITSFNGAYAGYVTDDKWYHLDEYETRTMAWLGRGNGQYFSEIITKAILKTHGE
jgi:neutral ceramidase